MVLSNVPSRSNITSFFIELLVYCLSYIDYLLVAKVEIKNELDAVRLHHVGTTVNYACSE
ncbi:hypothetical protein F020042I8_20950 [Bacteroides xylanisolvens]